MNKNIKKKILIAMAIVVAGTTAMTNVNIKEVSSHGFINKSRAALGQQGINVNVGGAQYEPQSIEAKGGFPEFGPKDGEIAGAGIFPELDEQSADRWVKVPMNGGKNTFTWTNTAPHRTSEWKYYITKKGWDVNDKLDRGDFELIDVVDGKNEIPGKTVTHTINVPTDREGYYVILGVWEIADTGNAFYQVMDIDLKNKDIVEDTIAPTIPKFLRTSNKTTNTISLTWEKSTDNVEVSHYNIYRDGVKVAESAKNEFLDTALKANTEYSYSVTAVDTSGNESIKSNIISVTTEKLPEIDTEAPTAPENLHSMGETTTSIDLMWRASIDNVAVDHYEIYRDGALINKTNNTRYMDVNLNSNTEYSYHIKAVDKAGNVSDTSNILKIKTKEDTIASGTWDKDKVYLQGDKVIYNGIEYTAKWWTKGDIPETSDAWKKDSSVITEWDKSLAYNGGDKVTYNGSTYEAKWWTKGEKPSESSVWIKL